MPVFLFDEIIFGPVKSRRLGISLGINLLPLKYKFCNFDCIYCECGRTYKDKYINDSFHTSNQVKTKLKETLLKMKENNEALDVITFAGNGEPTMHPDFEKIIDDTIEIRNNYFPEAKIAVLSNATLINNTKVYNALLKVDYNILKLDSAFNKTAQLINNPPKNYSIEKTVDMLMKFNGNLIIQTMFVKGYYNEIKVDNTTEEEILAWVELLKKIKPKKVMIYTIDRDTPSQGLQKVEEKKLNEIADFINSQGFETQVSK